MAAGDATFVPKRNVAYRVTFPIFDADGDLVTGAAGLDSEVSKDGGTFADATSEATEIATSSGMYFLDLTATEMDADTVAIIVKTSTSGAKTTPIVLYTATRDIDDLTFPTVSGRSTDVAATGEVGVDFSNVNGTLDASEIGADAFTAAKFAADVTTELQSGLATSAALTTAQADLDDIQTRLPAALVSGRIDASVGAMAANVMTAAAAAADLTTELQAGLATAATQTTIAGYLDTEVAAILAAVDTEVAAIKAKTDNLPAAPAATGDIPTTVQIADAVLDEALTELAAVPSASPTLRAAVQFLYMHLRNRTTTTSSATTVQNDAGTTIATATVADDGTTATKDEYA